MFNAKQQPTDNAIEKYYWCQMTSKKNPIQMKMLLQEIPQQVNVQKVAEKATRKKMVERAREIVQCRKFHHNCLDNIIAPAQRPLNA